MKYCLCLLVLLLPYLAISQEDYIVKSKRISTAEGLPTVSTACILEDDKHLIWAGTAKGISRWDGFEFINLNQSNSGLRIKRISNLAKDHNENIWAYNVTQDYKFPQSPRPSSSLNNIKSIDIIDPITLEVDEFNNYVNNQIKEENIRSITSTPHGIWIETYDEKFYTYSTNLREVKIKNAPPRLKYLIPSHESPKHYWGHSENNIYYLNHDGSVIHNTSILAEEYILETTQYDGKLFVLAYSRNTISKNIIKIYAINHQGQVRSINHPNFKLTNMIKDDLDVIRFQINPIGKNLINIRTRYVNSIFNLAFEPVVVPELEPILVNNRTNYCITDSNKFLWQSTSDGLLVSSVQSKLFTSYLASDTPLASIRSLVSTHEDTLIVLTERGIKQIAKGNASFEEKIGKLEDFCIDIVSLSDDRCLATVLGPSLLDINVREKTVDKIELRHTGKSIHKDTNGTVWIGTINGLYPYDPKTRTVDYNIFDPVDSLIFVNQEINYIHDNDAGLWVATNDGLFLLDKDHKIARHFNKDNGLPFERIFHIHEDKGKFWLGTDGYGLIHWDPTTNDYSQFTTEHGLSNNYVHGVYQDTTGYLWLPTDNGLSVYNIQEKQFYVFTTDQGLTNNEFNKYSHYQDDNGDLYFGTINGVNRFNPYELNQQLPNKNPVVLLRFEARNSDSGNYYSKMSQLKEYGYIELNTSDEYVNIEFSSVEFLQNELRGFYYYIDGLSSSWQYLENNNLQLVTLPHGEYQLKIRSNTGLSRDEDSILSIRIVVEKPYYLKRPFLISMVLLIGLITHLLIQWRLSYLKNINKRLQNEVRTRTKELDEVNTSKDKLFAILAHDLRGPISSFNNLSKKVQYLVSKKEWDQLNAMTQQIQDDSTRLDQIISNLIPWVLVQSKNPEIIPSEFQIYTTIDRTLEQLSINIKDKSITIVNTVKKKHMVMADPTAIEIIIRNLLSNAIKYSRPKGSIEITSKLEDYKVVLSVKDYGIGIAKDVLSDLFSDYTSRKGTTGEKGHGLGLKLSRDLAVRNNGTLTMSSEPNLGTTATVRLPTS